MPPPSATGGIPARQATTRARRRTTGPAVPSRTRSCTTSDLDTATSTSRVGARLGTGQRYQHINQQNRSPFGAWRGTIRHTGQCREQYSYWDSACAGTPVRATMAQAVTITAQPACLGADSTSGYDGPTRRAAPLREPVLQRLAHSVRGKTAATATRCPLDLGLPVPTRSST